MKALHIIGLGIAASMLGGCSTITSWSHKGYGVGDIDLSNENTALLLRNALIKKEKSEAKDAKPENEEGKAENQGIINKDCMNVPVATTMAAACQQQRNDMLANLLIASDSMCQAHLKSIFGNDAVFNISAGTVTNLAAGWATVATAVTAKATLAAVAAFSNAERSLVNEVVYKNMLVTAVSKKIREAREQKAQNLLPGSLDRSVNDYTVNMALHDVLSYHYTCSFMYGLEKALEEGSQSGLDAQRAKLELERSRLESYIDSRRAMLKAQQLPESSDTGLSGAITRLSAIDEQLKKLSGSSSAGNAVTTGEAKKATNPDVSLTPAKLEFSAAKPGPQTITYTNGSGKQVKKVRLDLNNRSNDFQVTHNCSEVMEIDWQCSATVSFTPPADKTRKESVLVITDDTPGSPRVVTLVGKSD